MARTPRLLRFLRLLTARRGLAKLALLRRPTLLKIPGVGSGNQVTVEMHGGSLDLQSEVGVGTTVTVRFPAERIVRSPRDNMAAGAADKKAG